VSGLNKGLTKVEVTLKWDPSPAGSAPHDLDLIAATYPADDPHGDPAYLVHFDSRAPDGTITLHRDSPDGQGFGPDEAMTLELDRLSESYGRVVVGVVIQQSSGRLVFGDVASTSVHLLQHGDELAQNDFAGVADATAATVAEFLRDESGAWSLHMLVRGFDGDPETFAQRMGRA
jgi:tellurium resistance protein TerD